VDPTPAKRHCSLAEAVLHMPRHLPHDTVCIDEWWCGVREGRGGVGWESVDVISSEE